MSRAVTFILTLLAFMLSASAFAETSDLNAYFGVSASLENRVMLREMAACIVDKFPSAAQAELRADDDLTGMREHHPEIMDFGCFKPAWFRTKSVTLSEQVFPSALAEALLHKDYGGQPLPGIDKVAPLKHLSLPRLDLSTLPTKYRRGFEIEWFMNDLEIGGECVARKAPEKVLALAETKPGSNGEETAFAALREPLSDCAAGSPLVGVQPFLWRIALSENLYLLLDTARPVVHNQAASKAPIPSHGHP